MPDRHLTILRDAARRAARRAREHDEHGAAPARGEEERARDLRRLATRARKRLEAATRRRSLKRD